MRKKYRWPGRDRRTRACWYAPSCFPGFEETDILSFGGTLGYLKVDGTASVIMTFIPPFPIYPPETSWMREPGTNIPGLILNKLAESGNSLSFLPTLTGSLPAITCRTMATSLLILSGGRPVTIYLFRSESPGLIDCSMYRKKNSLILHLVNLTSAATWSQPVDEYIPVGPVIRG